MQLRFDFQFRERIGFILFAGLTASLIWITGYTPQSDGYYHAINAKLIVDLLTGDCPLAAQIYQFNDRLVPNWIGHGFMAALIYGGAPILWAEKILMSLCMILPALGFRYMLRQAQVNTVYSWIVLALGLNIFVIFGLYNYLLSIGFGLYCIGWYLRAERNGWTIPCVAILAMLSVASWLSHMLGFLTAGLFIALCELQPLVLSLKNKQGFANYLQKRSKLIVAFIPAILLTIIYLAQDFTPIDFYGGNERLDLALPMISQFLTFGFLQGTLRGFNIELTIIQFILSLFILIALLLTAKKRSISPLGIKLLAGTSILVFLAVVTSNISLMGGWQIGDRLLFSAFLFLLFAAATLERFQAHAFIMVVAFIIFSANALWLQHKGDGQKAHAAEILDVVPRVRNNSLVLNLALIKNYNASNLLNIRNTGNSCIVDVANYEAAAEIFPLRYRIDTKFLPISNSTFVVPGTDKYMCDVIPMAPADPDRFAANNHLPPIEAVYVWGDLPLLDKELSAKKSPLNKQYFDKYRRTFEADLENNLFKQRPLLYKYDRNGHHYLRVYGARK